MIRCESSTKRKESVPASGYVATPPVTTAVPFEFLGGFFPEIRNVPIGLPQTSVESAGIIINSGYTLRVQL